MVQGTPPGGSRPSDQYPPSAASAYHNGPHGFAPPRVSLPPAVSKRERGPWFGILVLAASVVVLGGVMAAAVFAFQRFAQVPLAAEGGASATAKLPDWVPIFPNSTDLVTQLNPRNARLGGAASLLAREPLEDVLNFYRVASKRKGLTITALTANESQFVVEAKSQDGQSKLLVTGERQGPQTAVKLLLSTQHADKQPPVPGDVLPDHLPLVPGSRVLQQVTRASGKNSHGLIKFELNKPAAQILDFYEEKLTSAGLAVTREQSLITAKKKSVEVANVIVLASGGKTQVSLIAKAE